jgi:heparosan-N-sulfate-glucuronate 5-epimerase
MGAADTPGQGRLNRLLSADFGQPVSAHLDLDGGLAYYLDLSVKAPAPEWPPPWMADVPGLWVEPIQYGLGCLENHVRTGERSWLETAIAAGDHLVAAQQDGDGPTAGAWLHHDPLGHTYDLQVPWVSAMPQGEAASLLVRLHRATGRPDFAAAARAAIAPLRWLTSEGGASAPLGDARIPEEYPTQPPSLVLNGAIYALWGLRDVATGLDDARAATDFEAGVEALARHLHHWDTGRWSRYDLYPHAGGHPNVASPAYHRLHIDQLSVRELLAPDERFSRMRARFEGYAASPRLRAGAFARKVGFRLRHPRGRGGAPVVTRAQMRR